MRLSDFVSHPNAVRGAEAVYGKIFESIYDGSLYGHWEAIVTMQQLIVLADADGVIDMTPRAIAGKTSIPLEILEKGLKILSESDPYSRSPESNGVRIQLLLFLSLPTLADRIFDVLEKC